MRRRALLLVNHNSRRGGESLDTALAALEAGGLTLLRPRLDQPGRLPELIRQHSHEVDLVVVGGGDGSLNAAASALVETGLPLGILPLGTANDLARTLAIPLEPDAACAVIQQGVPHRIDLGRVNGRFFFNVAHIGLAVRVAHEMSTGAKERLGIAAYAGALARALLAVRALRTFRADIECDGQRMRMRAVQLSIGNGRHFGGGMTVEQGACIDDGCLDLCSIEPLDWRAALRLAWRAPQLRAGRYDVRDPVRVRRARSIHVHTARAMAVSADGEIIARTPAHFELVPSALEVLVPASYFEQRKEVIDAAQE